VAGMRRRPEPDEPAGELVAEAERGSA